MRFVIIIMVIGAVVAFLGYQEMQLASVAKETPQSISCADLAEKGYGDNAHITLTQFIMPPGTYVYKGDLKNSSKPWEAVWVPLVPEGGAHHQLLLSMLDEKGIPKGDPPPPKDIRVIFKSKKVKNDAALTATMDRPTVDGIIVNKIESLGTKEREMLQSSYPGIDFTKCWIIEHDRKPAGQPQIMGMIGGGAAAVILPGLFFFMRRKNA